MVFLRYVGICLVITTSFGCALGRSRATDPSAPKKHFSRGMCEISVGGTAGIHTINNDVIDSASTASLGPSYGYFVTDELEILGALGITYEKVKYEKTTMPLAVDYYKQSDYSIAVGGQYNFDTGAQVIPFARIFVGVMDSRRETRQVNIPVIGVAEDKRKTTDPYVGLRVGIRYFIADNISCDFGLGGQRVFYDRDFGGNTDDYSLIVGCAFFF